MSEQKHLVFVYGTLKIGERNHHFLKDAELIWDKCWTYGELYDTGKGYPAMVEHPEHRVYGELYRVTDEQLREVDLLEGYVGPSGDNYYERIVQRVYTHVDVQEALVYVYDPTKGKGLIWVKSGEWNTGLK